MFVFNIIEYSLLASSLTCEKRVTKAIFIFLACMMLLVPGLLSAGEIAIADQLILCTPFLLLFGIPHGAIDHVLFLRKSNDKKFAFVGIYLIIIAFNVGLWLLIPSFAYVVFLLLSAYHFGQGQFTHYFKEQRFLHKSLYLLWGISLISALLYFNQNEIQHIAREYDEFAQFDTVHNFKLIRLIFLSTTASVLLLMVYMIAINLITIEAFMMESLVLMIIFICFYLTPLVIGFSLYFVILHSIKVMGEEYHFLTSEKDITSAWQFIKLVAPFTLFSLIGIGLLFLLIHLGLLHISYGYCLLIVISSITLPHVFVMNRFYGLLFRKKLYPLIP